MYKNLTRLTASNLPATHRSIACVIIISKMSGSSNILLKLKILLKSYVLKLKNYRAHIYLKVRDNLYFLIFVLFIIK